MRRSRGRLFPGENPVGRVIELIPARATPWTRHPGRSTIVGVAANVKEVGFNEVEFSDIYVPFAQMPAPAFDWSRDGPAGDQVIPALRAAAAAIDPRSPGHARRDAGGASTGAFREDGSTCC